MTTSSKRSRWLSVIDRPFSPGLPGTAFGERPLAWKLPTETSLERETRRPLE